MGDSDPDNWTATRACRWTPAANISVTCIAPQRAHNKRGQGETPSQLATHTRAPNAHTQAAVPRRTLRPLAARRPSMAVPPMRYPAASKPRSLHISRAHTLNKHSSNRATRRKPRPPTGANASGERCTLKPPYKSFAPQGESSAPRGAQPRHHQHTEPANTAKCDATQNSNRPSLQHTCSVQPSTEAHQYIDAGHDLDAVHRQARINGKTDDKSMANAPFRIQPM